MAASTSMMLTPGNILAESPVSLRLRPEHLGRHIFIAGGSGNGKSKLIELLARQLISQGCGFTYVDPHGDGVDAIVQYLASSKVDAGRVHLLRPGLDCCFSFDPFDGLGDASAISYEARLDSAVDRVARAFLRNIALADMEMMKRLQRWLKNVLSACAIDVDGKHLGIAHALTLTNPKRPEFVEIFRRIGPALERVKPDVFHDFEMLRDCKSDATRNTLIESTINCLRGVLGVGVRLLFGQHAPSLDLKHVIVNRGIQLVNLRESDYLSRDQGNVIGGLLINFLIGTARRLGDSLPPDKRVPHYVIIDEAENFIGEDLRTGFAELRKFGLSLCLAVQDLSCLRKGEMDLVNKVVSQCGLQLTFQQQSPDDIEYLAKAFGYGSLDMTPLLVNEVLPDGYDRIITKSVNVGDNWSHTDSQSQTASRSHSETRQQNIAESINEQVSTALSTSHTEGESSTFGESTSESDSVSEGEGIGRTSTHQRGIGESVTRTESSSAAENQRGEHSGSAASKSSGSSKSASESFGESISHTFNRNEAHSRGSTQSSSAGSSSSDTRGKTVSSAEGTSRTTGETAGQSEGVSFGETRGDADMRGGSSGVSFTETWRPRHKITEKPSGKLVMSVQDQLYAIMNRLASLPDRMVLVKCKGLGFPFLLKVHEVLDPYEQKRKLEGKHAPYSEAWKASDMRRLLESIRSAHPYYFVPKEVADSAILTESATRDEPVAKRSRTFMDAPADRENPFPDEK